MSSFSVLALLSESNLFLMPTRKVNNSVEGFGISFIEAASYGVASIGGEEGGSGKIWDFYFGGLI